MDFYRWIDVDLDAVILINLEISSDFETALI